MMTLLSLPLLLAYTFQVHTNADLIYDIERLGDTLLLATNGGVVLYDPTGFRTLRKYTSLEGVAGNVVRDLSPDPRGGIWAVSRGGLVFRPPGSPSFQTYPAVRLPLWAPHARAVVWTNDQVIVGGPGGLIQIMTGGTYAPEDDLVRVLSQSEGFPFPSDTVTSLSVERDTLYVGFCNGWNYAPVSEMGSPAAWGIAASPGPCTDSVFAVLKWGTAVLLGTSRGLLIPDSAQILFPDTAVRDFAFRNDTLFVATSGGAWMISPTLRPAWTYYPDVRVVSLFGPDLWGGLGWKRYPDDQSPLPTAAGWGGLARAPSTEPPAEFYHIEGPYSNVITSAERGDSLVWVGSFFQAYRSVTLARYDGRHYEGTGYRWPIYSVVPEGDSAAWVATWGLGAIRVVARDSTFTASDTLKPGGNRLTTDLARTPDGRLVISVGSERPQPTTFLVDPSTGMIRSIDDAFRIPTQCEVDDSGRVWIASEGLVRVYDTSGTFLAVLSTAEGVPEGRINILKAAGGSLWIGGQGGLAEFQGLQWVRDFTGLPSPEVLDVDLWENRLFVLTTGGLAVLSRASGEVMESFTLETAPFPDSLRLLAGRAPIPQVRNTLVLLPEKDQVWIGTRGGVLVIEGLFGGGTAPRLLAYPNPLKAGEFLHLRLPTAARIRLLTLRGERIWEGEGGPGEVSLPTETLAPGLYLLSVQGQNIREVLKIAVKGGP